MSTKIDYGNLEHFPLTDKLSAALMYRIGVKEPHFFNIMAAYYFSVVASNMRVSVLTKDRGAYPINMFAVNLATSGFGKSHCVSILDKEVIHRFYETFLGSTKPERTEMLLDKMAHDRAAKTDESPEVEMVQILKDFRSTGSYLPVFDSGTAAAFKQLRQHLTMAGCGSMNMMTDELGSNLSQIKEILLAFMEAYDTGHIKPKLIKHTKEQERVVVKEGCTPTNWVGFGTPVRVLDGGHSETEFFELMETGFARRCLFGYMGGNMVDSEEGTPMSAAEIYAQRTDNRASDFLNQLANQLEACARPGLLNSNLSLSKETSIYLIEYQLRNEALARKLPEYRTMERAELDHRHSKVLKLAGAYAFVDGSTEVTIEYINYAIRLAEDSGKHFQALLQQEPAHVRLAKYIGSVGVAQTQADLVGKLPYYRGTEAAKREMMTLAISWGTKHKISIRRIFEGGVETFLGAMLVETDLNKIRLSYSNKIDVDYRPEVVPFQNLHKLTQLPEMHWCAHQFKNSKRHSDYAIPGFNLLILDIDDGSSIELVKKLLEDYSFLIHTTKRHGLPDPDPTVATVDRFRVIIPLSHTMTLNTEDYSKFMSSIFDALPFSVDKATKDIARKWLTHDGEYWYNVGKTWDVLPHIPETVAAEEHAEKMAPYIHLDSIERFFMATTGQGNRSNSMIRFGLLLLDQGYEVDEVIQRVTDLNDKIQDPLDIDELEVTIFRTLRKRANTV